MRHTQVAAADLSYREGQRLAPGVYRWQGNLHDAGEILNAVGAPITERSLDMLAGILAAAFEANRLNFVRHDVTG